MQYLLFEKYIQNNNQPISLGQEQSLQQLKFTNTCLLVQKNQIYELK